MNLTLKHVSQIVITLVVAYGFFAFGSYDARDELRVLTPSPVAATETSELDVPELNTPPTLDVPELDTPELDVPELNVPKLDVPELDVPEIKDKDYTVRKCKIWSNFTTVNKGESVKISWETDGYDYVKINDEKVSESGHKIFENVQVNTTYTLTAKTKDGKHNCSKTVTIKCIPPVTPKLPECELLPALQTINSGEKAQLTWTTENAEEVFFTDIGAVELNGNREVGPLTETTTYVLKAKKGDKKVQCEATVKVKKDEKPTPPVCPLKAKDGRTIIDFGDTRIRSDQSENNSRTAVENVTVPAGTYDITLVAWDGYIGRENTSQPNESYVLAFVSNGSTEVTSNQSPDLADNVREATVVETVNTGFVLSQAVNGVRAEHAVYPDNSSANSLQPICAALDKEPEVPAPSCDFFTADPTTITKGESVLLEWGTTNVTQVTIDNAVGSQPVDGTFTVSPSADITYTLSAFAANGTKDQCTVDIIVKDTPVDTVPKCTLFTANGASDKVTLPVGGGDVELAWETLRADSVSIDPTPGTVTNNGTTSVTVTTDTTYTLTASQTDGDKDSCIVEIEVEKPVDTVPECSFLTANGVDGTLTLPVGGGTVEFEWATLRADSVSIDPTIGSVSDTGTTSLTVTSDTIYTLIASQTDGDQASCTVTIDVEEDQPVPISCGANVSFTASDSKIDEGDEVTLTWSTTNITSLSINNGITSTALNDSESIRLTNDTTFTLTATDGVDTIDCPVSVEVEDNPSGGGGGGSSSPRCELTISDRDIRRGEEITLVWETRRTNDIRLFDDHGEVYIDTDDMFGDKKEDLLDDRLTLEPDRDTTYTLVAERGRRDRECTVRVNVEDDVVVLEARDQQPLVAGISLTQVPYTGFEAGPILTVLFYLLLGAWALFVTYILVIRRESLAGVSLAQTPAPAMAKTDREIAPELFVENIKDSVVASTAVAPANLPTAATDMNFAPAAVTEQAENDDVMEIENRVHAHNILMSSDAIAHFMTINPSKTERLAQLDEIITTAKVSFPTEDGWVVINLERMKQLCTSRDNTKTEDVTVVPTGSGSLAEAIVTGNITGAYALIGQRPMIALADAAADLDGLYRKRQGEQVATSDLLDSASTSLEPTQLKAAIAALTSALDGTYSSEEEAVKMAIMKAVKAVS